MRFAVVRCAFGVLPSSLLAAAVVRRRAATLAEASSPPKQPGPAHEDAHLLQAARPSPRCPAGSRTITRRPSRPSSSPASACLPPRASAPPPSKAPPPAPPHPALVAACEAASRQSPAPSPRPARKAFFEQHFTPNAVVHNGPQGLLTGYYEPLLEGSRTPQGAFQTPIYKRPPDLVNLVDETQRGAVGTALTHARKTDKGVEPYRHARRRSSRARSRARTSSSSTSPTRSTCSSCRSRARAASS